MKKSVLFSVVLVFLAGFSLPIFGQDKENNPYNAQYLIDQGVEYHDKGEFARALACYDKINVNDSVWFMAQVEKTLTLLEEKKYEELITVANAMLKDPFNRHPYTYLHLGIALDETGKYEEAVKVFEEGNRLFPGNFSLYYSKGIIHQKKGELKLAVQSFQNALMANPFHPASHLKLGYLCAERGYFTQATLSLTAFLMVSGNDSLKLSVLADLDRYLSQKNDIEGAEIEGLYEDEFKTTDQIIGNHLALHKSYKLKSKLDYPVVRQIQALAENIKFRKNAKGFWMRYYVPFFSRIVAEDYLDGFVHLVMSAGTNEKIVKQVKKKQSDIKAFSTWANGTWLEPYKEVSLAFPDEAKGMKYVYREGSRIYGITNSESEKPRKGRWVFLQENGCLMSLGGFNDLGERHGKWTFFSTNGRINSSVEYENGKEDGILQDFDPYGYLTRELHLKAGELEGPEVHFYPNGDTLSYVMNRNGKAEGVSFTRFATGAKELEFFYKEGKLDGTIRRYFDNGNIDLEVVFRDGKKEGAYKTYYADGKLKREETYKDDKSNGLMKEYHPNGQLAREVNILDDNFTGLCKEWYENGTLSEENTYNQEGKLNGTSRFYTRDGKLHIQLDYKNGKTESFLCYNIEGKVQAEGKPSRGKLNYKVFYPEGGLKMEGVYVNGERDGVFTFYSRYGAVDQVETYSDGKLDGLLTEYFSDGGVDKEIQYKNGSREGNYKEYYRNGELYAQGKYLDGDNAGEWLSYSPGKVILYGNYYLQGDYHGWQDYYTNFGKLWHRVNYYKGKITGEIFLDTLGNPSETLSLKGHTGILTSHWPNGKVRSEVQLVNGVMHGRFTWYFSNGKPETEGAMHNGKRHGDWKHYQYSGVLKETGKYVHGEKTGIWTEYNQSGLKNTETSFVRNDEDGKVLDYYENGKVESEGTYREGKLDGPYRFYAQDGELAYVLYYKEGAVMGYSYNGPDRKLLPMIASANGSFAINAKFANGKTSVTGEYKDGILAGSWVWYNTAGMKEAECGYLKGLREGNRFLYYPDGKIKMKETYVKRMREGMKTEYNPDGSLKREIPYSRDTEQGWARIYDAKGKLTKSLFYYSGDVIEEK